MFYLQLQKDASYHVIMPDSSRIKLAKGVQDTPELRRELAKLSHRIATREFIVNDKNYIKEWTINPDGLSSDQLEDLIEIYSDIQPDNEIWKLLSEYPDEHLEELALSERDILKEYELLHTIKKDRYAKSSSSKENQEE